MLKVEPAYKDVARREADKAGREYTNATTRLDLSKPSDRMAEEREWNRYKRTIAAIVRRYRFAPVQTSRRR